VLVIDGAQGEGGGQIVRTSLSLSCLLDVPVELVNIRANRPNPGLRPQHLTGVKAMAQICQAKVAGGYIGSPRLRFEPQTEPQAGKYSFDVAEAWKGGSAGAVSLIFQTLLLPLASARADSELVLIGGTHVAWSPPYHYLRHVYLPAVQKMGIWARVSIERWGWYPLGGGKMRVRIRGQGTEGSSDNLLSLSPVRLEDRGALVRVWGISAVSNLPDHIVERQRRRAEEILRARGFEVQIDGVRAPSRGRGTMLFLVVECERTSAGFTAHGQRGKPAETVAEEACRQLLEWWGSNAALDRHLADQLVLPTALADGESTFTTCCVTRHLLTNIWVVERFGLAYFEVEGDLGAPGKITVKRTNSGAQKIPRPRCL